MKEDVYIYGSSNLINRVEDELSEQNLNKVDKSDLDLNSFIDEVYAPENRNIKKIIFFSDTKIARKHHFEDPDLFSIHIASKICEINKQKKKNVVFEVLKTETRDIIKNKFEFNVISVRSFGAELLAHSVISPSIIEIFRSLVSSIENSVDIHVKKIPDDMVSATNNYQNLKINLDKKITPIGYLGANEKIILNPDADSILKKGFKLIYIAEKEDDFTGVINAVADDKVEKILDENSLQNQPE